MCPDLDDDHLDHDGHDVDHDDDDYNVVVVVDDDGYHP